VPRVSERRHVRRRVEVHSLHAATPPSPRRAAVSSELDDLTAEPVLVLASRRTLQRPAHDRNASPRWRRGCAARHDPTSIRQGRREGARAPLARAIAPAVATAALGVHNPLITPPAIAPNPFSSPSSTRAPQHSTDSAANAPCPGRGCCCSAPRRPPPPPHSSAGGCPPPAAPPTPPAGSRPWPAGRARPGGGAGVDAASSTAAVSSAPPRV
jgi:hypothetical protein